MTRHFSQLAFGWLLLIVAFLTPLSGYSAPETFGTIQGRAWNDLNNNGLQDGGEMGMGTVWVQIETPTGGWVNGGYTNMDGDYSFGNIPGGASYRVKIANPGNGFNGATPNVGSNDAIDSDVDLNGFSPVFSLAVGQTVDIDGGFTTGGQCYTPVTASGSNAQCVNGQFTFQITATGGTSFGGVSWGWNGAGLSMQPYGTPVTVGPFPASGPATVTVTDVDNPFCTATVTMNPPPGCSGGGSPTLSINDVTVNENAGTATLQICASASSTSAITVQYSTSNGSATSGSDYSSASGTATIPAGQTCVNVTVPILDDNVNEPTESLNVNLSNPSGATIADGTGTVTILDNDGGGQPDCNNVNITASGTTITITGLTAPIIQIQAYDAAWAPVHNQNYTNQPGTVTIPNLAAGQYFVKVVFFNASWGHICTKEVFVNVPGGGCQNVNNGGTIGSDQTICPGATPAKLTNVALPSGGSGTLEYIWLSSTTGCPTNISQQIPGSTSSEYQPGPLTQTTWFVRCSRRAGCADWTVGESNCVKITVSSVGCGGNLTLTCPIDMSVQAASGATSAVVNYNAPTSSTTCAGGAVNVTRTSGPASGSAFPIGTTQVCFQATDNCGNVKTCCFNVTVTPGGGGPNCDNISITTSGSSINIAGLTAPVIIVQAFNSSWMQVFNQNYMSPNPPGGTVSIPNLPAGTYFVKVDFLTAQWAAVCKKEVYITVGGTPTNLTLTCPVDMSATAAPGANGAVVNYPAPTSSTTCAGGAVNVTRTSGPASGSMFPVGTTQVCFSATDNCGNSKTCCFSVTVNPAPPTNLTLTCPIDMSVTAAPNATGAVVTYNQPTASTTCAGGAVNLTRVSGLASGSTFPIGTTQVCYQATDNCGNNKSCCFNVTVNPAPPTNLTLTCPIDMTVTASVGQNTAIVTYPTPTATTTCPGGAVNIVRTSGLASGSAFPVGTTQVCHSATDNCGNVKTCCFNVTVQAAPVNCDSKTDGCIKVDLVSINTGSNGQKTMAFKVTSTCAHGLSYAAFALPAGCSAISGNSYTGTSGRTYTVENGTNNPFYSIKFNSNTEGIKNGESETFVVVLGSSCQIPNSVVVEIKENGFTHRVTLSTANCGGSNAILNTTCPVDMTITAQAGQNTAIATYALPTATTTCPGGAVNIVRTSGLASGSAFPVGTTQVCYSATDNCGNVKTCCFNVTVNPGGPVCTANRTATNSIEKNSGTSCNNGQTYGIWLNAKWPGNTSTTSQYFQISGASFVENNDGTATLTGVATNNSLSTVKFNVNVTFCGRTFTAPSGSPKTADCYTINSAGWYYYTTFCGTLTGTDGAAGAVIKIDRQGPAFQVGNGANINESAQFGASGWFNTMIQSHPTGKTLTYTTGDFNIRLSGTPTSSQCGNGTASCTACTPTFPDVTKCYKIVNKASGKVLDADYSPNLVQWSIDMSSSQRWKFESAGSNYFRIKSQASSLAGQNKVIEVTNGSTSEDADVNIATQSTGAAKQEFSLQSAGGGYYYIVARHSGKAIKLVSNPGSNGTEIMQRTINSANEHQKWQIVVADCNTGLAAAQNALTFSARRQGASVELDWISNTGDRNDYFVIERSTDGTNWTPIKKVDGAGQPDEMLFFEQFDLTPAKGENLYRLHLVFRDGSDTYSNVQKVLMPDSKAFSLFPNPAANTVWVDVSAFIGQPVQITLLDPLGKAVQSVQVDEATTDAIQIDLNRINNGYYSVQISSNGVVRTGRLVVSKTE